MRIMDGENHLNICIQSQLCYRPPDKCKRPITFHLDLLWSIDQLLEKQRGAWSVLAELFTEQLPAAVRKAELL